MNAESMANGLLDEFKGGRYVRGPGVLARAGELARKQGTRALLVRDTFPGQRQVRRRHPRLPGEGGRGHPRGGGGRRSQCPPGGCAADHRTGQGRRPRAAGELRRRKHDRRHKGGRGPAHPGRRDRRIFRHGPGCQEARGHGQGPAAARRHSDRGELGRAPDQVLQHHRRRRGPEKADRRRGGGPALSSVRFQRHLRRPQDPRNGRSAGRHIARA